jgi:hypothetical protein
MKIRYLIFELSFLICASNLFGQSKNTEKLVFPLLTIECQSNIIVTADLDHPKPCPPEYTNLLSNTNLFSLAEQTKLDEITRKYKNVTTNSTPAGSVFRQWALRRRLGVELTSISTWVEVTNTFQVACFTYTNSDANEEMAFFDDNEIDARFRTQAGDGYDVYMLDDAIVKYQEYRSGLLDGLFVEIHDPNSPDDKDHCVGWARFVKGKLLGKYIMWQDGQIEAMAEFKQPFDFLKCQTVKTDLSWTELPTNTAQSSK